MSVLDDGILSPILCADDQRGKQQVNVQVAVKNSVFTGPSFLVRAPHGAEAHMDYARAAPLPFETARGVALDMAWTDNFRVGADRDFPEIKQAGPRETGIGSIFALQ